MKNRFIYGVLAGLMCLTATAEDIDFCYSNLNNTPDWYGTGMSDTYDVAIRITDEGMVGSKVKGIKVPFKTVEGVTDIKGWITTELKLENKVNVADITSVEMTYSDGYLTAIFGTPYEITEKGVYLGYSFTIPDVKANENLAAPVAVSELKNPDAFYIHTPKQYRKWRDYSSESGLGTYITMIIEGNFNDVSTGITIPEELYFKAESNTVSIPLELIARGKVSLKEFGFTYEVTDSKGTKYSNEGIRTFEQPVDVQFGHSYFTEVLLDESFPKEIYDGTFTLKSVNGTENTDPRASSKLHFETLSKVPIHKPVMEEYTGLWCGWCPRGYASLLHMNRKYPGQFIGISYHNNDDMMIMAPENFPSKVTGFPAAWLDREVSLDAFSGTSGEGFGFEKDWLAKRALFTPIAVDVLAYFDKDDEDLIHVESEVTSVKDVNMGYKVAYVLLADGLSSPNWSQANNFGGNTAYSMIEEMAPFIASGGPVSGLVFDDIIVRHSDLGGVEDSLPYPMVTDETYEGTYEFRVSECVNMFTLPVIRDKDKLRAVVLVVDSFNRIVNANVANVTHSREESLGINGVSETDLVSTDFYDLRGVKVSNPEKGIYVKVETYSNGLHKSTKVIID